MQREADRSGGAEITKTHKVGEQTIHDWNKHFNWLKPPTEPRLPSSDPEFSCHHTVRRFPLDALHALAISTAIC